MFFIFPILIAVTIQTFICSSATIRFWMTVHDSALWIIRLECVLLHAEDSKTILPLPSENWCWSTVSESGIGVSHIHSRNPGYNGSTRKKLRKFLSVLEWIVDALDFHGEFAIWHSGGKVTELQLAQWLCFNMKSYEVLQKHIRHHDGTKAFCLLSSTLHQERPLKEWERATWWHGG